MKLSNQETNQPFSEYIRKRYITYVNQSLKEVINIHSTIFKLKEK